MTSLPNEQHRIPEFELSLLKMDSRIRVFNLYDELEENQGYLPRKEMICIPVGLPSADHEIAHMVEMNNPKRLVLPDWGMPHPAVGYKAPKNFFQALSREIRVRAIQDHMRSKPNPQFPEGHCGWEHEIAPRLPFGRFKSPQDVFDWSHNLWEKTHKAWSRERIVEEWKKRLNIISDWMETKAAA